MSRKAKQASSIQAEPIGRRDVKDPWNTLIPFAEMRVILCDSARAMLKALERERYGTAEELEDERYGKL